MSGEQKIDPGFSSLFLITRHFPLITAVEILRGVYSELKYGDSSSVAAATSSE